MAMRSAGTQNQIARTQALQAYSQPNIDPEIAQQVSRLSGVTVFSSTADLFYLHCLPISLAQKNEAAGLRAVPENPPHNCEHSLCDAIGSPPGTT